MNKIIYKLLLVGLVATLPTYGSDDFTEVEATLKKAMQSAIRTEKDIKRDANRLPIETLKFFGLKPDMKVLELLPGNGWYTKLLAPVVVDEGELFVSLGITRFTETLAGKEGVEFVTILDPGSDIRKPEKGARFFTMNEFDFGPKDLDMVVTFRNYHNFDQEGRMNINDAAFRALKSGGIYAVVDHTRRHMEATNDQNYRRIDPVLAIKEVQEAGFKFVDFSDLHYRAVDTLAHEVGHKEVTGRTDRFTLKFVKP